MRTVFNNEELCHVWASQSQKEGRSGSMFFENNLIYSYGYHYLAAKIYSSNGSQFVLVNSHKYSNTTSRHLSEIRSAVTHMRCLEVSSVSDPKKSLGLEHARLGERFYEFLSLRSARYTSWYTFNELWKGYREEIDLFNEACIFFKQKNLMIKVDVLHRELWFEKYQELSIKAKAKSESQKLEREKKEEEERKQLPIDIQNWRLGAQASNAVRRLSPQIIRIKDDDVETSSGARVPLTEAIKLLKRIQNGSAKKNDKIGYYKLDRVKKNQVIIGCHTIDLKEAISVLAPTRLRLIQGGAK